MIFIENNRNNMSPDLQISASLRESYKVTWRPDAMVATVVSGILEVEVGGLLAPRSLRSAWTHEEIPPL
jgi:hypothetical protein